MGNVGNVEGLAEIKGGLSVQTGWLLTTNNRITEKLKNRK